MVAKNDRTVTVFGGTGFLGRRIVRYLRSCGFPVRVASRHPDRGHRLFGPDDPQLQSVEANIHDERSVAEALAGAYGVVNAVSLYVERGQQTFHSVHVEAAQRVAAQARRAGVERLVHVSGIGADAASPSRYIRKRGEGELESGPRSPMHFRPPGCDVRVGRRVSHHHPQAASAASNLSDVRPRPDQIATGLCGRRCGSGCSSHAASRDAFDNIRVRRPARLLLRAISQSRCAPSWPRAPIDSNPACRLARTGMGLRNLPKPAPHAQSIKWN
jgi:hypothetical protein